MKTTTEKTEWKITELETFFDNAILPTEPLKINVTCHITDMRAFINSHIEVCRLHDGDTNYLAYLERLYHLKEWIENRK